MDNNNSIEVFDNLPTLDMFLPIDVKETLVYIAGYTVRKDESTEGTSNYFDKFRDFAVELSHGVLAKPNDTSCQFVFSGHILLREIMHVNKKSLCNGYCRYIYIH